MKTIPREQFNLLSDEFDAAQATGKLPKCPICHEGVANNRTFKTSPKLSTMSFTCGHVVGADLTG